MWWRGASADDWQMWAIQYWLSVTGYHYLLTAVLAYAADGLVAVAADVPSVYALARPLVAVEPVFAVWPDRKQISVH